jgi:hypothetical protein
MKLKDIIVEGMPSTVIKHKQRLSMMNKDEFNEYIKKAATERNRTPKEHAQKLEVLHAMLPGKYVNRLTESTEMKEPFEAVIYYGKDGKSRPEHLGYFDTEEKANKEAKKLAGDKYAYVIINWKTGKREHFNKITEGIHDPDFDVLVDYKGDGKFEWIDSFHSEGVAKREGKSAAQGKQYRVKNTESGEVRTYKGDSVVKEAALTTLNPTGEKPWKPSMDAPKKRTPAIGTLAFEKLPKYEQDRLRKAYEKRTEKKGT